MTSAKNLWQRLADAQGRVDYVQKEKKQGMNYSIVSHDAVTAKVRPVLVECGIHYHPVALSFSQNGNRTEVALTVRFVNVDKPDEFIDVPSLGYGIDTQDKGPGKAISYAVKYALLKTLGLETGDDPDLDQNVKHESEDTTLPPVHKPSKNVVTREEYKVLTKALENAATLTAVQKWRVDNVTALDALPTDWKDELWVTYTDKTSQLKAKVAA